METGEIREGQGGMRYDDGIPDRTPSPELIDRMDTAGKRKFKVLRRPVEAVIGGRRWADIKFCAITFGTTIDVVEGWIKEGKYKWR